MTKYSNIRRWKRSLDIWYSPGTGRIFEDPVICATTNPGGRPGSCPAPLAPPSTTTNATGRNSFIFACVFVYIGAPQWGWRPLLLTENPGSTSVGYTRFNQMTVLPLQFLSLTICDSERDC